MELSEVDTIVVPAKEENFKEIFIKKNTWYGINMNPKLVNQIKFIAVYRSKPTSAVTHFAYIESIKRDPNLGYVFTFKGEPKPIGPIPNVFNEAHKIAILIGSRYTQLDVLKKGKYLADVLYA